MKLTDMVISAILKRGILYEAKHVEAEFEVPTSQLGITEETKENKVTIKVKVEHMTLRIEKE
jgi:hypothetical protein